MNKKKGLDVDYNSIEIPEALDTMINKEIKISNRRRLRRHITAVASCGIILLSSFTYGVNSSESFANSLKDIPVISSIANVLTFSDRTIQKENHQEVIKTPEVSNLNDEAFEDSINKLIQGRVDAIMVEAESRMLEYKEAYIETGGSEEGFKEKNYTILVDYNVTYQSTDYISFSVFSHESLAAVYSNFIYYNINVDNNTLVTLEDLIGDNYKEIITGKVNKHIEDTSDVIPYFQETIEGDWVLDDHINYFIDSEKDIIIVFEKYSLAPGSSGRLEIKIGSLE